MAKENSAIPEEKKEAVASQIDNLLGDEKTPPKKSKKKLIIIGGVVFLCIAIGAGLYFSGKLSSAPKPAAKEGAVVEEKKIPTEWSYVALEDFLVNISTGHAQTGLLKLSISIEVPTLTGQEALKENMPRLRHSFIVYLRELRVEDIRSSGFVSRMQEELLLRANEVLYPIKVDDLRFTEMIMQ